MTDYARHGRGNSSAILSAKNPIARGIAGNIHMMITDKIKLRVAEVIQKWIGETTCR